MPKGNEGLLNNVSRETLQRLNDYVALLQKWQKHINLVSSKTEEVWTRHIEDSLQIAHWLPSERQNIYDLGSGGGLPGIVLATACPAHEYYLIESDQRKCVFLREAARHLDLKNTHILHNRIEEIEPETKADIITSRALASLPELLRYSLPLSHKNTFYLFLKGKNWDIEIAEAKQHWNFRVEAIPSRTSQESKLLRIDQVVAPTC